MFIVTKTNSDYLLFPKLNENNLTSLFTIERSSKVINAQFL